MNRSNQPLDSGYSKPSQKSGLDQKMGTQKTKNMVYHSKIMIDIDVIIHMYKYIYIYTVYIYICSPIMSQQYVPKNHPLYPIFLGKSRGDAGFPTCLIHTVRFTSIHRGSDLATREVYSESREIPDGSSLCIISRCPTVLL